jgi:hypothetical protein
VVTDGYLDYEKEFRKLNPKEVIEIPPGRSNYSSYFLFNDSLSKCVSRSEIEEFFKKDYGLIPAFRVDSTYKVRGLVWGIHARPDDKLMSKVNRETALAVMWDKWFREMGFQKSEVEHIPFSMPVDNWKEQVERFLSDE